MSWISCSLVLTCTWEQHPVPLCSVSMGNWFPASLENDFHILCRLMSGDMADWFKLFLVYTKIRKMAKIYYIPVWDWIGNKQTKLGYLHFFYFPHVVTKIWPFKTTSAHSMHFFVSLSKSELYSKLSLMSSKSFTKVFSFYLWTLCNNFYCLFSLFMCFVQFTAYLKESLHLKTFQICEMLCVYMLL